MSGDGLWMLAGESDGLNDYVGDITDVAIGETGDVALRVYQHPGGTLIRV